MSRTATFDASQVRKSAQGAGLIRVFASDGLNTASADVRALTAAGGR
jgi:hypothetical protein